MRGEGLMVVRNELKMEALVSIGMKLSELTIVI